jgi:hypothetical protein
MDQLRTTSDMMNEAHRRASRHAPLPKWHPVTGGIAGAAAAAGPMIIFADVNVGISLYAVVLTAAIGFAWGFFYLKRRKDAYDRAWNRELEYLRGKRNPG